MNNDNINELVDKTTNITQRFFNKINDSNINAFKLSFKNKSKEELHELLKETQEFIKTEETRLKEKNIINSIRIFDKEIERIISIVAPAGSVLVEVNNYVKPLKQAMMREIAIKELLKEYNTNSVTESTKCDNTFNDMNGVQLIESVLSNVEESSSILVNYTNMNLGVMSNDDSVMLLSKIKDIDNPDINTIKQTISSQIENKQTGEMMLSDLYVDELRSKAMIPPAIREMLNECVINPLNPDKSAVAIFKFICEANTNPFYTSTLITDILPLANSLIESDNSYIDLLGDLPQVLYKNILNETNYETMVPCRHILREFVNCEIDWHEDKIKECKLLLDKHIRETCKDPDLNKIMGTQPGTFCGDEIDLLVNRAKLLYADLVRESMYLLAKDDESEITIEQLTLFTKLCMTHQTLIEAAGHQSLVWKAGNAVDKASRKVLNNGKGAYDTSGRNTTGFNKAASNVEKLINYPLNAIIKGDKSERRQRLVEGRWRLKIWKLLRKAIGGRLLFAAFGPVAAAIGVITSIALDKTLDRKVRNEIVHEMETELRVINEKIEDSKSDNNKKEKYQLMRLKDKMEKDIERIKYGLKGKY